LRQFLSASIKYLCDFEDVWEITLHASLGRMPSLVVSKIVPADDDAICSVIMQTTPVLQIARFVGAKWNILYVSYRSEQHQSEAQKSLRKVCRRVQQIPGIPQPVATGEGGLSFFASPPVVQTLDQFQENVFPLLLFGYDARTSKTGVAAFFGQMTDLAPHNEVCEGAAAGAFVVNFLDFEDAIKFLAIYRDHADQHETHNVTCHHKLSARPQGKTLLMLRLWSDLSLRGVDEFLGDYVRTISRQLSQEALSPEIALALLNSVPSIFCEKNQEALPESRMERGCEDALVRSAQLERGASPASVAGDKDVRFGIVANTNMQQLFQKHNFFQFCLETEMQGHDIVAVLADFFRCVVFFLYGSEWHSMSEVYKTETLVDCIHSATLDHLQGLVPEEWTPGDFVHVFASPILRNAVFHISNLYPIQAQEHRTIPINIGCVLAMDNLVNRLRARDKYCKVLLNTDQTIFYAVKSIGFCVNISNLNDNMTRRSLDLITAVLSSAKQIIQEFIAKYDVERVAVLHQRRHCIPSLA